MSPTPQPQSTTTAARERVFDAMGSLHDEADRWTLAEALLAAVPQNTSNRWFEKLNDDATSRGIPTLSVTTLRQYRDTAARWPADKRVKGASFTAHREVQPLIPDDGDTTDARRLLEQLIDSHGAAKTTAVRVRQAVRAHQGVANPPKPITSTTVSFADLMKGGEKMIAAILGANLAPAALDSIHAGLTAVLTAVETERVKAARKQGAQAAQAARPVKPTPPPTPAPAPNGEPAPVEVTGIPATVGTVGDLRGL